MTYDKLLKRNPRTQSESAIASRPSPPQVVRFGAFEVDLTVGEVRKAGLRQKLAGQPFQVLQALLERPGEIMTREELRQCLWPDNTYVDYELALKKAVNRLREVLGDSAESPHFIETVPRRGYRFIGSISPPLASSGSDKQGPEVVDVSTRSVAARGSRRGLLWKFVATLILASGAATLLWLNAGRLRTRIFARSHGVEIRSVAVLPLQNLSNDPDQEYFSDGMTDELITDLAKVGRLQVISHTSVERYKRTKRTLPGIAQELGVDAIVEGQVLRSGDRVRISAQLIDARTDRHLWAESYERSLKDVLSLQAEVAQQIAAQIGIRLADSEQTRMAVAGEVNPVAHEAFLKGMFYWGHSNCDGSKKGLEYFQEAVAKDPRFAPAYVGLAQSYFTLGDWGCRPPDEVFPRSKTAALKAIALDATLGSPHAWLGMLASFEEWDWVTAETEFSRAIELDPNYAVAHISYAVFLIDMGRRDQSFAEMKKAHELDPTSELTNMVSVHVLYLAREYDQAIEQARASLELYPDSWGTYVWLGASYERKGLYDQAIEANLKSDALAHVGRDELSALRNGYVKSGIQGYWQQELVAAKRERSICGMVLPYAHLEEKERTLEYLSQAVDQHCDSLRMLNADPVYDSFRADRRFQAILRRMNFPR